MVNYDAGHELLERYQSYWSEIHAKTEITALCASVSLKPLPNPISLTLQKFNMNEEIAKLKKPYGSAGNGTCFIKSFPRKWMK